MAKSGSSDVAALLRQEILRGDFATNDQLPASRTLADKYGVARNTLMSALTNLQAEGLIEIRRGSGSYVVYRPQEISSDAIRSATPLELIDARFALEPHICRLCVLHARRDDIDALEGMCDTMEAAAGDAVAFSEADTEYHRALANSTRNSLLIWIISQITMVRSMEDWQRMRRVTLEPNIIAKYNIQHRQVVDAIRAREPERAANFMKEHLESARLSLTRASDT